MEEPPLDAGRVAPVWQPEWHPGRTWNGGETRHLRTGPPGFGLADICPSARAPIPPILGSNFWDASMIGKGCACGTRRAKLGSRRASEANGEGVLRVNRASGAQSRPCRRQHQRSKDPADRHAKGRKAKGDDEWQARGVGMGQRGMLEFATTANADEERETWGSGMSAACVHFTTGSQK